MHPPLTPLLTRELMDGIEYKVQPNDTIVFISTLHGGWAAVVCNK